MRLNVFLNYVPEAGAGLAGVELAGAGPTGAELVISQSNLFQPVRISFLAPTIFSVTETISQAPKKKTHPRMADSIKLLACCIIFWLPADAM